MRALGPVRAAASAVVPSHAPEAVPSGAVDNPEPNTSRYRNDVWVCGHVLFPGAATARVEVTVDGGPPMRAPLHRVAAVCDFELLIPPSALPDGAGEVTLSVTAMSTAGESIELGTPTLRLLPPQRGTEQDDVLATELRERVVTAGAGRQSGDRLIAFAQGVVHNGAPEQLLGLATRLSAGGAPVTTVAEMERSLQDRFEAAGTPVQMSTPVSLTSPAHYESRLAELASWVARQAPRGIVVQGIDSFPAVDLASRLEIPCVWLLHETVDPTVWWITHALAGPEFEYARDRASTALHGATATVFPSAAIRALYAPFIEPGRAHVVPNGVDTAAIMRFRAGFEVKAARAALGITADTTVIFSPGRISPRSNKIELLQGLAEVGDRRGNVCLVLPSPGDLASEETTVLRDYAARAGLGDVIRILPAAGGYHWYAMADLVVVDAEAGDVPLFPLEAMAFENVVLASRVGGIDETIEHGTHGWLWDQNDLDGLIAAFASALSMSPNERREMGAEAAARIAERHRASDSDAALLRLLSRAPMLPDP
jgi:glycosyltransferase involved in cell wall biosynthesis